MSELDNIIADVSFLFELYRHSEDPLVTPIIQDIDDIRRDLMAKYEGMWPELFSEQRPQ